VKRLAVNSRLQRLACLPLLAGAIASRSRSTLGKPMTSKTKTEDVARSNNRVVALGTAEMKTLARHPSPGSQPRGLIDAALTLDGDVHTDRELEVDGKVTGNLSCTRLIVGKNATITGTVKADEVVVRGKVKGTIRAGRLILQDTAHVDGEIFHDRLIIEEGAQFMGASNPDGAMRSAAVARFN